MTKRIDPLSAEALAVPLPASFRPSPALDSMTETLADAHQAAPTRAAMTEGDPIRGIVAALAAARQRPALWIGALAFSLALHAAVTLFFIEPPEPVQIAGGAPAPVAVLGNAFENMQAAGEMVEEPTVTQPVETPPQTQPLETPTETQPLERAEVQPAAEPQQTRPLQAETSQPTQSEHAETSPVADTQPQAADSIVVSEAPETAPQEVEEAETVEPRETTAPELEPVEAVQPETAETPVETAEAIEPLPDPIEDVPVPTPRPEYTPPPPPRQTAEQPRPQPQPQPSQGSRGQQAANQTRGSADGQANEGATAQGSRQASGGQAAGNAAVSNYPGKVVSRLRRALRYPSAANRDRLSGEVQVRFTVSASGSVSGISVVRSSGYAILDQAAVATVQRAAPFPAIPPAAGRSSWPFTVPLAFSR